MKDRSTWKHMAIEKQTAKRMRIGYGPKTKSLSQIGFPFCLISFLMMQVVDIQLGMAIDSIQATMAVKRRLACEMVKYWHQV